MAKAKKIVDTVEPRRARNKKAEAPTEAEWNKVIGFLKWGLGLRLDMEGQREALTQGAAWLEENLL